MWRIERAARAKINLALHVTGRRADGYHLLDSLVVFADCGDKLELASAEKTSLEIIGPFSAGLQVDGDNLVLRAYQNLSNSLNTPLPPTAFLLTKNLPVSSGIGGGSADAAAALNGLVELWQLDVDQQTLSETALSLGADVPVCLDSRTCRMSGVGEMLTDVANFAPVDCVLVNPGVAVSTPAVFGALALPVDEAAFAGLPEIPTGDFIGWFGETRNDLQRAAIDLTPEIAETTTALEQTPDCQLARMSGSGATCFGLFNNPESANEAVAQIARNHPDWWVLATQVG